MPGVAASEPAPGRLVLSFGDQAYASEINMCQAMPGMIILAGESASGEERIKVLFQDAGGERGVVVVAVDADVLLTAAAEDGELRIEVRGGAHF